MPAESERLRRRVGARDRWFVGVAVAAAVIVTPPALLLSRHGSTAGSGARCVSTVRAGFMGGETRTFCGADAVAFCRAQAALPSPESDCIRRGFVADPAQP